jgi:hypothetical protein
MDLLGSPSGLGTGPYDGMEWSSEISDHGPRPPPRTSSLIVDAGAVRFCICMDGKGLEPLLTLVLHKASR